MHKDPVKSRDHLESIWKKKPLIISGPCSAETEEQVLDTAARLKAIGKVDILRAGIWKPRTKPGMFEGVGAKGLPWLQKAGELTGLPTTVEVATAKQVEASLMFGVSVLWIGARTTVNPFSVQEIADALRGTDLPVLIKNPINPDLELWSGAVERMARAGISKIGLIHRGFSTYGTSEYRNAPLWHLAIDMKLRHPDLLFITDPSHICGKRDTIPAVIQRAIDLDSDGLMIESHMDPANAWSDAAQQVTPEQLASILDAVIWRREDVNSMEYHAALDRLRQQINQFDEELLQLVSRRMRVAEQIAQYKRDNNITILQPGRWQEILDRTMTKAASLGLSQQFINQYLDAIHLESIAHQKQVLDAVNQNPSS